MNYLTLDELQRVIGDKKIVIYGAHQIAKDFYEYLKRHELNQSILGFSVTSTVGNPEMIEELSVKQISAYCEHAMDCIVFVATPEKFHDEIINDLTDFNFQNIYKIGAEGIASLTNPELIVFFNERMPEIKACQDDMEYNCIDLFVSGKKYKFLTIGAYPPRENYCEILRSFDFHKDYLDREECSENNGEFLINDGKVEVFVVGGLNQMSALNELECFEKIMVVGINKEQRALIENNQKNGFFFDCTGENIADMNNQYAEMAAAYWIWKNCTADYKGLCHYRRRFLLDDKIRVRLENDETDVIVLAPHIHLPSIRESFHKISNLKDDDLKRIERVFLEIDFEYGMAFQKMLNGCELLANNMVIARREIYNNYCEWIFGMIRKICEKIPEGHRQKKRYEAYLAELLTSVYFMVNKEKYEIQYAEYRLDTN